MTQSVKENYFIIHKTLYILVIPQGLKNILMELLSIVLRIYVSFKDTLATRMEDWTSMGQHRRKSEFPVETREIGRAHV